MTKRKKQKQKQNKRKENKRAKEEKKIHIYIYIYVCVCFNVFLMFSAFRDDMELYALSAGMVFPKFVSNE